MRKTVLAMSILMVAASLGSRAAWAQTPPPRIFYSDIVSGPSTGGPNNQGSIVNIWGKNFGATQGSSTVTVGGVAAASYLLWQDDRIAFQIGSGAKTGNIVVNVPALGASNGVAFTVRSGRLLCVSTAGSDSAAGTLPSACWKSVQSSVDKTVAGDILYLMSGVTFGDVFLDHGGQVGSPIAVVAYPGATPSGTGFDSNAINGPNDNIVIAGLKLSKTTTTVMGIRDADNVRIVANDLSCPGGDGQDGCFSIGYKINDKIPGARLYFLGNYVHDNGKVTGGSKQYHSVYFTTDTNHFESAWNRLVNNHTCYSMQVHSSPTESGTGFNQYDFTVHDNYIDGDKCQGMNFVTIDPSKGPIEIYNNVIMNTGAGPDTSEGSFDLGCIRIGGGFNSGGPGSGVVKIYNNTLYNCGNASWATSGQLRSAIEFNANESNGAITLQTWNNVVVQTVSFAPYLAGDTNLIKCTGPNLWFGNGGAPNCGTGQLSADPKFLNVGGKDFRLLLGSPAIDVGTNSGIATDSLGTPRPQGSAFDLGAFEFITGTVVQQPNTPANVRTIVH